MEYGTVRRLSTADRATAPTTNTSAADNDHFGAEQHPQLYAPGAVLRDGPMNDAVEKAHTFVARHRPSIVTCLTTLLVVALIVIIVVSTASSRDKRPHDATDANDSSRSAGFGGRYRTYNVAPSENAQYSVSFILLNRPFTDSLRSLASSQYTELSHGLEVAWNALMSSGQASNLSLSQLMFFEETKDNRIRVHFKIFADLYKIIIEEKKDSKGFAEYKDQTNSKKNSLESFILDLLQSNDYRFSDFEIDPNSIHVYDSASADFYPVGPEYGEDLRCKDIDYVLFQTGNSCINFLRMIEPGSQIGDNERVCNELQMIEHCLVEEMRPYRCSIKSIHENLVGYLQENRYLSPTFDCPDGCHSTASILNFTMPKFCGNQVDALLKSASKVGERIEQIDCEKLHDLEECTKKSLYKQGYCERMNINELMNSFRQDFEVKFGIDPKICYGFECADSKLTELVNEVLHDKELCVSIKETLDPQNNKDIDEESSQILEADLRDCIDHEISKKLDYSQNGVLRCLDAEVKRAMQTNYPNHLYLSALESEDDSSAPGDLNNSKFLISAQNYKEYLGDCGTPIIEQIVSNRFLDEKCLYFRELVSCVHKNACPRTNSASDAENQAEGKDEDHCSWNKIRLVLQDESFGGFYGDLCQYQEGDAKTHGIKILSTGPMILFDILSRPQSGQLQEIEFYSVIPNTNIELEVWRMKGSEGVDKTKYELIRSVELQIKYKGLNRADLTEQNLIINESDSLALNFEDSIIPLPIMENAKTSRSHSVFYNQDNFNFEVGSKIHTYESLDSVEFPIKLTLMKFAESEEKIAETETKSRSARLVRTNEQSGDDSSEISDLFASLGRNEGEECSEFTPFSDFYVPETSYLCDLASIITDEAVEECARLSEDCKDGIRQSDPNSCLKLYTFTGCMAKKLDAANLNCEAKTIDSLQQELDKYASEVLVDNITVADCSLEYGFDEEPLRQTYPASPYDEKIIVDVLQRNCYFVPISEFSQFDAKCSYAFTIAECIKTSLFDLGYGEVETLQIWQVIQTLSVSSSDFLLNTPNFRAIECGSIEDVKQAESNFTIDTCTDLRNFNEIFNKNCSRLISQSQDCEAYDSMKKCMLSTISASDSSSTCDMRSVDNLMIQNRLFFISNYNGFDPSSCIEGQERENQECSIENIVAVASDNCFESLSSLTQWSPTMTCNGVLEMLSCTKQITTCPYKDLIFALMDQRAYFKEILGVDPLICKLNEEIKQEFSNYTHSGQIDKQCENSPLVWLSASELSPGRLNFAFEEYLEAIAIEEESLSKISEVCQISVPFIGVEIRNHLDREFGFFCPYEQLRDRIYEVYSIQPYIEFTKQLCDNLTYILNSAEASEKDEELPIITEVHIESSGCLRYATESSETSINCKNVDKFFDCMQIYADTVLGFSQSPPADGQAQQDLAYHILTTRRDYLLEKFDDSSRGCLKLYAGRYREEMHDSTGQVPCAEYFDEAQIDNSGCLEFLSEKDARCKGVQDFFTCLTIYTHSIGQKCARESLIDTLIDTQGNYLYYKSSVEQRVCIEPLITRDDCLDNYPEPMLRNSTCLPLIQGDEETCESWNDFLDCFALDYQKNVGDCATERIYDALLTNQRDLLKELASPSLASCLGEHQEGSEDQHDNCFVEINQSMLDTSNCKSILGETENSSCRQIDAFHSCLNDYTSKEHPECASSMSAEIASGVHRDLFRQNSSSALLSCPKLNIGLEVCYDEYSMEVFEASECLPILTYPNGDCKVSCQLPESRLIHVL
ncbi:MAG: hypothetical protein MHMPM18_001653 [Marteilia pararefringens]